MAKRVSSIYGNALFELAVEEKKVDALLSEVQTLQQILLENADLLSLLNHPEGLRGYPLEKTESSVTHE